MQLVHRLIPCVLTSLCLLSFTATAQSRLDEAYPDLADGILAQARLDALPEGELMRSDNIVITVAMLDEKLENLPEAMREQAKSYLFFLLEGMAAESILMREVLGDVEAEPDEETTQTKFRAYMLNAVGEVVVDDAEVETFYKENQEMMSGMPLEQIRDSIEGHLKQQRQEAAWDAHMRSMGSRISIALNDAWIADQVKRMQDNPVDNARAAGKPTLVKFGAEWCGPCRMLKPILQSVKEQYGDQVTILDLDTEEHQFLASRFKVSGIPLLIFYDKDGKEVLRHTGFMAEEELVKQLKEIGAT